MFNTEGYSLSDVAAVTGNNNAWGNDGSWWIIILFLFCFMGWGGNGFGNNGFANAVSSEDMQNQFNFASLERQNNEIVANSRQVAYDLSNDIAQLGLALNTAIRDQGALLNENIRDSQSLIQGLGASMENCCCMTNRNIDSVRYDAALNTRDIMKNDCDNTQKILIVGRHLFCIFKKFGNCVFAVLFFLDFFSWVVSVVLLCIFVLNIFLNRFRL